MLAGSRLESAADAGVAHFMEHLTFKGTTAYPSSRAISEASRALAAPRTRPPIASPRSTGRASRVAAAAEAMDVLGELVVRPTLTDADIDQERTVIIEEIRSYLDDPAEYCQMLSQQAMFGDGPLGREICGDAEGIRALPGSSDPRVLERDVPAGEHRRRGRRRPRAR